MKLNELKDQLTRAFFISLICLIGFGATALLVSDKRIARLDNAIITLVRQLESPAMTNIMKFFTYIGGGLPATVISLLVLFFLYKVLHHRKELILFIGVVLGSELLNLALKFIFHRARPDLHRIVNASGFSFPSGHSMAAFSLYGVIAFLLWRHIPTSFGRGMLICLSVFMIGAIGVSRIYLGVHYPSDVIGGFLASGCWLAISIWFYQRYQERLFEKRRAR